ncbi:Hypothetical predicted protein [Mytilus galloprovincialis]|uniref:Uncharacterized protein n=1 Tax=Mytilus galloprovincialis TaxID=29158 RepID=A0A8B6FAX0_MYTGA|nr:Hypothetical predicted protein [Mytilus galloprovincialis]
MKTVYYKIAVGLFSIALSADIVVAFPNNCTCPSNKDQVNVDCASKGLTVVPENIPSNAHIIIDATTLPTIKRTGNMTFDCWTATSSRCKCVNCNVCTTERVHAIMQQTVQMTVHVLNAIGGPELNKSVIW